MFEAKILVDSNSMQKSKYLGLDGFPIKFYLGFYDFLKYDLLKMVKELKDQCKFFGFINVIFWCLIHRFIMKHHVWSITLSLATMSFTKSYLKPFLEGSIPFWTHIFHMKNLASFKIRTSWTLLFLHGHSRGLITKWISNYITTSSSTFPYATSQSNN